MDCNQARARGQARLRLRVPPPRFATKIRSVTAPAGRPTSRGDLGEEIEELAALLAEVVELAGNRAMFPGSWELIAELAMGHKSVRRALLAAETVS